MVRCSMLIKERWLFDEQYYTIQFHRVTNTLHLTSDLWLKSRNYSIQNTSSHSICTSLRNWHSTNARMPWFLVYITHAAASLRCGMPFRHPCLCLHVLCLFPNILSCDCLYSRLSTFFNTYLVKIDDK